MERVEIVPLNTLEDEHKNTPFLAYVKRIVERIGFWVVHNVDKSSKESLNMSLFR